MVDGSGLENQHVRKGIVGSNPTLSVYPPLPFFSGGEAISVKNYQCLEVTAAK